MSLRQIADSAFVKLTRDCFGGSSRDHIAQMRACFAKGLDKKATATFNGHLTRLAVGNPDAKELTTLAAAMDYVPMLSETVAMRYGCRQAGCDVVPKHETEWFHGRQPGRERVHWLCSACRGEFAYGVKAKIPGHPTDGRGQDKGLPAHPFLRGPVGRSGRDRDAVREGNGPNAGET